MPTLVSSQWQGLNSMPSFPSDSKAFLIVCEDIRPEQGKKTSLLGIFGGNVNVNVPPEMSSKPFALPGLGFYFAFLDGELRRYNYTVSVKTPSGVEILPSDQIESIEKDNIGWLVIAFKLQPFPVENGVFTVTITLDGNPYVRTFEVTSNVSATAPVGASAG